ncbi:ACT domain-containing protein [Nanoarchaeota archaeon]
MKEKVIIRKEKFAIFISKKIYNEAFANIKSEEGITTIIEEDKVDKNDVVKIEKDYRLITFGMDLPFDLVGFISRISKALADVGISIFVVSSYSTDHILVKQKDINRSVEILETLNFEVVIE